ncbi:MAG: rhamnulokinase [Lachnospiraceae bacterium]|nr:rhamnulokinase [Lachnospiraceae bacterium]
MSEYYLAVDIGASGGRHILGRVVRGKLELEEIYRFENGMDRSDGHLYWDVDRLFSEIKKGMIIAGKQEKHPVSMSVDTWAVDYVLLDGSDKLIGNAYGYRDPRTEGIPEQVYVRISEAQLYRRTGIQKQSFNTVFQLTALREQEPEALQQARTMLMLPDYFQFLLTGVKKQEYTNATSTGLVNCETGDWDRELIRALGLPEEIFLPPEMPGTILGHLSDAVRLEVGYDCEVVLCASHDTASAVMAVPAVSDRPLYLSSGTWSLMGVEAGQAITGPTAMALNFTNEGGYDHRFRFLKNIMGLWMIQQVRHELGDACSFAQLCDLAEREQDFPSLVDVNDPVFLSPESMCEAVRKYCRKTHQPVPESAGEMAAVIYRSLADAYARTLGEIEQVTGQRYEQISVVGGGSNASYLNRLTAQKTGRTVIAGPGEATAIGNLLAQMIGKGIFRNLADARACVRASFPITEYKG